MVPNNIHQLCHNTHNRTRILVFSQLSHAGPRAAHVHTRGCTRQDVLGSTLKCTVIAGGYVFSLSYQVMMIDGRSVWIGSVRCNYDRGIPFVARIYLVLRDSELE